MLSIPDHHGVECAVGKKRTVHKMAAKIRVGGREARKKNAKRWDRDTFLFHLSTWVTVCSLVLPTCTLFRPEVPS